MGCPHKDSSPNLCVRVCVWVCADASYTSLNYQAGECHSAMAASHTANSELESHPAHKHAEESRSVLLTKRRSCRRGGRVQLAKQELN